MDIVELHNKAMEVSDTADMCLRSGDKDKAQNLYKEAFYLERDASSMAIQQNVGEPTESVLIKSAAFLAFDAQLYRESEKMVGFALSRDLPDGIAEEMRDLLENIHFARHLQLKGVTLSDNEIQISVAGRGVAHGMAREDDVNDRIATLKKLAIRTTERSKGVPFRRSGQPAKDIKDSCESYLSVARAASFAVTIRLGQTATNSISPEFPSQANALVDDIATNLSLANAGDLTSLQDRIKDPSYFENFVSLAKEFAPDGDDVILVGITYMKDGKELPIQLTRQKREFKPIIDEVHSICNVIRGEQIKAETRTDQITGTLSAADSTAEKLIILADKAKINVSVPDGLTDIVRKYFDETVTVTVRQEGEKRTLLSIDLS